jgi:uncharacterized protein (TIGR03089 family)
MGASFHLRRVRRVTRHSTFGELLSGLTDAEPGRPLVTFYDDATGERVELSVATYANWVAKTAGLAQDELGLDAESLVLIDLPTHWLGVVWLGACWTAGHCVTTDPGLAADADLVVCGPGGVPRHAGRAEDAAVVALSLRPLGGRFAAPLPPGVVDYGAEVLAQPDLFVPHDPPGPTTAAWRSADGELTQAGLLEAVAAAPLVALGGRLLTDLNPCSMAGRAAVLSPMLERGSAVWVANPDEARWRDRYEEERATAELRAVTSQ